MRIIRYVLLLIIEVLLYIASLTWLMINMFSYFNHDLNPITGTYTDLPTLIISGACTYSFSLSLWMSWDVMHHKSI